MYVVFKLDTDVDMFSPVADCSKPLPAKQLS